MPYSAAVTASMAILSSPIKDLYESGRDHFKNNLSKWNNSKSIASLASKVAAYEQVKTIWRREKKVKLSSFYYPSKVILDSKITGQISSLKDFPNSGGLVIQGTVGQGKSVFLRHLCVQELTNHSSGRIPVFVELRTLEADFNLEQALFQALGALGFEISDELFDFYASSGKLVALLDGFDELDESLVPGVMKKLDFWSQRYPQLQFIITARPGAEIQKSNHFDVIKLAPLTHSDHRPFLAKIGVKGESLKNLLLAIEKSNVEIKELLSTPLLLTLLVLVYQSEESVPKELPEFFKLLFTTVFTRHDRTKPAFIRAHKSGLTEGKLEKLFGAFCFSVLRGKYTVNLKLEQFNIAFSDALKFTDEKCELEGFKHDIVKVACLLQEDGLYVTFIHKSLLDFFPAAFIKNCTDDQAQKIYPAIAEHWKSWRATLQFLDDIDKYRFARYFAIPTLEQNLRYFDAPDGIINHDSESEIISKIIGKAHATYVKGEKSGKYELSETGPFCAPPNTYFFEDASIKYLDIFTHILFGDEIKLPFMENKESDKREISIPLVSLITLEQIEKAKKQ